MAKFKKGQIVKVVYNDSPHNGEILIVNENDSEIPYCLDANGIHYGALLEDKLTLATGYDAIVKGTVLKTKGDPFTDWTVLGIVGDAYIIKSPDGFAKIYTLGQLKVIFKPPTPTEDKGIEVFDKEGTSLGFMKEGKVITN